MATFNVTSDAVGAINSPIPNQVLTANYYGSGQWSSDLVVNSIAASGTLNATSIGAGTITGSGSIAINSGISYNHGYGCGCLSCNSQQSNITGPIYSGPIPVQISTGGQYITTPPDEMKSKPTYKESAHDHVIECRLKVENVKVIAEYFCFHCNEVLHSKVISKLPKSIMDKKCLPRIVKGV